MKSTLPPRRRAWRDVCRTGALLSAAMLGISVFGAITTRAELQPGAPPTPGQALSPATGTASTAMALTLTAPDNVCPGDTATRNFRWNTYIAASTVDAARIQWEPGQGGPAVVAGQFVQPLYNTIAGVPLISRNTAVNTGQIIGTQAFNFLTNTIPGNGTYTIGYSCTLGRITERYWATTVIVTDWTSVTSFNWATSAAPPPTTPTTVASTSTSAAVTTTTVAATTTTVAGATTTTAAGATTTTVAGATTTTLAGGASSTSSTSTTLAASAGPITTFATATAPIYTGSGGGGGGSIPVTGPSKLAQMIVWGLLTVVLGRMAVLLARPVRVLPPVRR